MSKHLLKRYITDDITELAFGHEKMAFIAGPRQCGKTTLAKAMLSERGVGEYYNWDEVKFRQLWQADPSAVLLDRKRPKPLIVLDEIHKATYWKRDLKGVYDTATVANDVIVTGSAKLDTYRKGGDSLQGRYFLFRLHPFSLAELLELKLAVSPEALLDALFSQALDPSQQAKSIFEQLMEFGPFPDPYLAADTRVANLWRQGRINKIVREEVRDLSLVTELSQLETLALLLPERVGSLLSIQSLREDLGVAYTTVKRWLDFFVALYYCYRLKPYSKRLSAAIKKSDKLYLWDWSQVAEPNARFENCMAMHLLKYCHYLTDTGQGNYQLHYIRNKQGKEIDFLITQNGEPWLPIEVKSAQLTPSENWSQFLLRLGCKRGIQVVNKPGVFNKVRSNSGEILLISADQFLMYLV